MTYNVGTATDYLDLKDQLIQVITSRHLDDIAINAAGTGYEVGEILDIDGTGATATHVAQIEVVTESAGVITAARIYRGGAYTVDPSTTTGNTSTTTDLLADGTAVASANGTGATFDLTFAATGWTLLTHESEAASATVGAGGSGYTNGSTDVLTVSGGVLAPGGSAATFTATVSAGAVTSAALLSAGDYEVVPSNPVATTVAPSGGTGCTLNVTWAEVSGDAIVVLQGDAGSALDPLVGIKTYSSETDETGGDTVYNWALFGMTSWSSILPLHEQANISDGFNAAADGTITTVTTGDGAFVPLKDSDAFDIDWYISATGRRVVLVARVEGSSTVYYSHAAFGLLNQFGVSTELPFPAFVAGTSDRKRVWYRDTSSIFGGLSEVIQRNNGPFFVWAPEGSWLVAKNAQINDNQATTPTYATENVSPRVNVWPLGPSNQHEVTNNITWAPASGTGFDNDDLTATPTATAIYRTPDTGGDLFPLFPVTVVQSDSGSDFFRTFGEVDGVWWFHVADATISSQDRFTQASVAYTVFQNGTRIQPFSYLALRED